MRDHFVRVVPRRAFWAVAIACAITVIAGAPVLAEDPSPDPNIIPTVTAVPPEPEIIVEGAGDSWSVAISLLSDGKTKVSLIPAAAKRTSAQPDGAMPDEAFEQREIPPAAFSTDPSAVEMIPEVPARVTISVSGAFPAGTYQGSVTLYVVTQIASDPEAPPIVETREIPIRVVVRAYNMLALLPGVSTVEAHRVRTNGWVDEALAWVFLERAEVEPTIPIPIVNDGGDPIDLAASVHAIGQHGDVTLSTANAKVTSDRSGSLTSTNTQVYGGRTLPRIVVSPDSFPSLTLGVTALDLPADVYKGSVELIDSRGNVAIAVPLVLTIRRGPTGPAILIILGILAGRALQVLLKSLFPVVGVRDALRKQNRRVALLVQVDAALLSEYETAVSDAIDDADGPAATKNLERRGAALAVLEDLERIEDLLRKPDSDEGKPIRRSIQLLNEANARKLVDDLSTKAINAPQPTPTPPPPASPLPAPPARSSPLAWVGALAAVVVAVAFLVGPLNLIQGPVPTHVAVATPPISIGFPTPAATASAPAGGTSSGTTTILPVVLLVAVLIALAVLLLSRRRSQVQNEAEVEEYQESPGEWLGRVWRRLAVKLASILRGPLYLVLIVGLWFVGMQTLYAGEGAAILTTQADPVVAFLLWGVGSDVASRTITGLVQSK